MRAISLLGVFLVARLLVLIDRPPALSVWSLPAYLWQDVFAALLFAGLDHLLRRRAWVGWALYATGALYVAINVPVARVLGTPLTWPMLRATRGTLGDSIAHHATPANLACLVAVLLTAVLLPLVLSRQRQKVSPRLLAMLVIMAVIALPLGPCAVSRLHTAGLHRNAVLALATTAFPRLTAAEASADWRTSPFGDLRGEDLTRFRGCAAGRNVLVVHLESTAASHLGLYGAPLDPCPTLTQLAEEAILFENAYTAYPETIKSFFAVHCGHHPAIDTAPDVYARASVPALAAVLAARGYRTGLFHSGRFGYLGMEEVLRGRGYEVLEDAAVIGSEHEGTFGIDEESTVRRLLRWLDEGHADRPFLATYLPIAGHHPYETPTPGPFPEHTDRDRYHNALHYGDTALRQLLDGLRQRGLLASTLVVICGDHGEAFGEHPGNIAHTLALYEENLRVPLLIAAPGAIRDAVWVRRIASLVDLAPTVLDLLGLPLPSTFEGHSLLEADAAMALFCTDYSLGLLGLRDGRWKCIHELESGRTALYDLATDPGETTDLAEIHPERTAAYREHLLRWGAAEKYWLLHPRAFR
jgi:arylsulfatase A-like enzyme